jgi:hypothetical protein
LRSPVLQFFKDFNMKKLAFFVIALFSVAAFAQESPDTGLPVTGQPNTGLPVTSQPNTGLPVTGQPNTGLPVTGQPNTGQPNTGQPNTGLPDTAGVQEQPSAAAVQLPEPPVAKESPEPPAAKELPQPAAGQHKDTVAVYMAGEEPKGAIGSHRILGVELEKAISKSKDYIAVNRTNEILKMLTKEHEYTRSGEVDDAQIKKIGKQFGAQYLCIVEINAANRGYYLAAQLVDVESARIINSSSAGSRLEDYNEQMAVAQKIALELVGDAEGRRTLQTSPAPELAAPQTEAPAGTADFTAGARWGTWALNVIPGLGSYVIMDDKKGAIANFAIGGGGLALLVMGGGGPLSVVGGVLWIAGGSAWNIYRSAAYHPPGYNPQNKTKKPKKPFSYGAGGVFAHNVGGGVYFERNGAEIAMPYNAGGGYLYFDLVYLELAAGFAGGGGKWKSFDTNYPELLPDMERTYINFGALLKLPFGGQSVKFFPLVGLEYEQSLSAEIKNGLSGIRQPDNGDLSALWFKFGVGLDIGLWQNAYLRTEALYGRRTANAYERYYEENSNYDSYQNDIGYVYSRPGDGLTLKMAIGLNIVKRQPDAENGNKHKNTEPAASGQKEEK